jgi:hypothetical protein
VILDQGLRQARLQEREVPGEQVEVLQPEQHPEEPQQQETWDPQPGQLVQQREQLQEVHPPRVQREIPEHQVTLAQPRQVAVLEQRPPEVPPPETPDQQVVQQVQSMEQEEQFRPVRQQEARIQTAHQDQVQQQEQLADQERLRAGIRERQLHKIKNSPGVFYFIYFVNSKRGLFLKAFPGNFPAKTLGNFPIIWYTCDSKTDNGIYFSHYYGTRSKR